jgi:hypothetical protein
VHFSKVWQWFRLMFVHLFFFTIYMYLRTNGDVLLKCLAEFSLHCRHHPFLQYLSLGRQWCWIHAPLKKIIIVWLVAKPLLRNVWLAKRWFSVVFYKSLEHTVFHVTSYTRASNILMMPKPRGFLTYLCICVDCTQLIHTLRISYLAHEQHNCLPPPQKKL